jgi:hypothetical protein
MTLTISNLSPDVERRLKSEAVRLGVREADYVKRRIERDMLADRTFDEILMPVRADFRKSGVTEEQLDEIVDRARKTTRPKGRRARR